MDLQDQLFGSSKRRRKGAGKFSVASLAVHGVIIAFVLFMSATAAHKVDAETKPIRAFRASGAPPPPPPPPPPPAASSAPHSTPQPTIKPVVTPTFVQPTEIPKELPKVEAPTTSAADVTPSSPASEPAGEPGGVPGGVVGGVQGGVQGGVVGGQVGGQVGGVLGGVQGGVVGGTVGGTGNAKEAEPEPKPDGPMRVGGDVKAPIVIHRVEPVYTDLARKAKITGIVIVEAIIDKDGNVDKVKVLKGLSMGLKESAEEAVRKWKFKPGTLNGEPVDVIFNLTVNFTLQ
jgi:protein TonB